MKIIGKKKWAIAEGYLPGWSNGPNPQMNSHETASILNVNNEDALITFTIYFSDREPIIYELNVPAKRTRHVRFDEFTKPSIPKETDYACTIISNVPIVVQHTRLDSRQAENALLGTIAYYQD